MAMSIAFTLCRLSFLWAGQTGDWWKRDVTNDGLETWRLPTSTRIFFGWSPAKTGGEEGVYRSLEDNLYLSGTDMETPVADPVANLTS